MKKTASVVFFVIGIFLLIFQSPVYALPLTVQPVLLKDGVLTDSVKNGDVFECRISLFGKEPDPSINYFNMGFTWAPEVLTLQDYMFGDPDEGDCIGGLSGSSGVSTSPGTITMWESGSLGGSLGAYQPENFSLATFWFAAIGAGTSNLDISLNSLQDGGGNSIVAGINQGNVNVSSPVPVDEPIPLFLLTIGLLSFPLIKRLTLTPCSHRV